MCVWSLCQWQFRTYCASSPHCSSNGICNLSRFVQLLKSLSACTHISHCVLIFKYVSTPSPSLNPSSPGCWGQNHCFSELSVIHHGLNIDLGQINVREGALEENTRLFLLFITSPPCVPSASFALMSHKWVGTRSDLFSGQGWRVEDEVCHNTLCICGPWCHFDNRKWLCSWYQCSACWPDNRWWYLYVVFGQKCWNNSSPVSIIYTDWCWFLIFFYTSTSCLHR